MTQLNFPSEESAITGKERKKTKNTRMLFRAEVCKINEQSFDLFISLLTSFAINYKTLFSHENETASARKRREKAEKFSFSSVKAHRGWAEEKVAQNFSLNQDSFPFQQCHSSVRKLRSCNCDVALFVPYLAASSSHWKFNNFFPLRFPFFSSSSSFRTGGGKLSHCNKFTFCLETRGKLFFNLCAIHKESSAI